MNDEEDYDLALSDPEDEDLQDAAIVKEPSLPSSLPLKENLPAIGFARNYLNTGHGPKNDGISIGPRISSDRGLGVSVGGKPISESPTSKSSLLVHRPSNSDMSFFDAFSSNGKLETDYQNSDALRKALADLAAERKTREKLEEAKKAAEEAHNSSFSRLKFLAQEACKQRDEALKVKEEALRSGEAAKKEMEKAAEVLNAESERILKKMPRNLKALENDPNISKLTGLPAIVYAVKRKLEVAVDEVIKERNSAREFADQRNMEHAIGLSELEAVISSLQGEKSKNEEEIKSWQKSLAHKDEMLKNVLSNVEECEKRIRESEASVAAEKKKTEEFESKWNDAVNELTDQKAASENFKNSMEEAQKNVKMFSDMVDDLQRRLSSIINIGKARGKWINRDEFNVFFKELSTEEPNEAAERLKAFGKAFELVIESNSKMEETYSTEKTNMEQSIHVLNENKKDLEKQILLLANSNDECARRTDGLSKEMRLKEKEISILEEKLKQVLEEMENEEAKKKVIELEIELQKEEREKERALGEKEQVLNEFEKIKKNISELEKKCDVMRNEKEEMETRVSNLENEKSCLNIQLQEFDTLLIHEREKTLDLENQIKSTEEKLSDQVLLNDEFKSKISSSLIQFARLNDLIEEERLGTQKWKDVLNDEILAKNSLQESFEAALEQLEAMKEQVEMWQREAEEWKDRVQAKEDMASSALIAREAAEESLSKSDKRIRELRLRVDDLERQMTQTEPDSGQAREAEPGCFARLNVWADAIRFLYWRRALVSAQGSGGSGSSNRELISEMETLLEPLM